MLIMCLQAASADEMQAWIQAVTAGISAQLDALAPSSVQATKGTGKGGGHGDKSESENSAENLKRKKEKEAQRQRQLKMILAAPGNGMCRLWR